MPADLIDDAAARLDAEDLPIFGMALQNTSEHDIAAVTGVERLGVRRRLDRMIRRLRVEVPDIDV